MYVKRWIMLFGLLLLLAGCLGQDQNLGIKPTENQSLPLNKLSAKGVTDQQPADQAKNILSEYDEVAGVRAVNSGEQLLIGVKLKHHDRFRMDDIERNLRKKVKRNFSDMDITLSTDEKIHLELTKLEEDLTNNNLSQKQIKKRLKKIKSLSKEET